MSHNRTIHEFPYADALIEDSPPPEPRTPSSAPPRARPVPPPVEEPPSSEENSEEEASGEEVSEAGPEEVPAPHAALLEPGSDLPPPTTSRQVAPVATAFVDSSKPPEPETAADLQPARVLRERPDQRGLWGWTVHLSTFGRREAADSPRQLQERRDVAAAQTTIARHRRVAVLSLKGGVGKTTTTAALGSTFASLRGDMVVAVDANPDAGTLAQRVGTQTSATVRNLLELEHSEMITSFPDLRQFLSQASSRLHVLASDQDPALSDAYDAQDYATTVGVLERFIPLVLTDCGTGMAHDALSGPGGVLDQAHQLVVACGPGVDEARSASSTLDWLRANGRADLVEQAVVVVTKVPEGPPKKTGVDFEEVESHFRTRVRATVRVPFDDHLYSGTRVELDKLHPRTRRAFLALAARVGENFGQTFPRSS